MKRPCLLLLLGCFFLVKAHAQITFNKVDTTMKIGKAGYRVDCRNKSTTQNPISIKPVGFESGARDISFTLKGRVSGVQIDDLNRDSYPDLIVYVYTDSSAIFGTVYCFISDGNKEIAACVLPDITIDPKVNKGYKGHDQLSLMEGTLLRRFPIYNTGDADDKPGGGTRTLMYQLAKGESGMYKFNLLRSFDTKQ
ncbi:MAG: hypothetical protein JST68_25010 [Bacteroidetes bacterium]|nr:hypothetical protein [Bacteroidota bacterium]